MYVNFTNHPIVLYHSTEYYCILAILLVSVYSSNVSLGFILHNYAIALLHSISL